MDDRIATFREACEDLGVSLTRTGPADLDEALMSAIEPPAVSTSLPWEVNPEAMDGVRSDPSWGDLEAAETGVTPARLGVAATGSVVLQSTPAGSEHLALYTDRHVAVLPAEDLVGDLETAFDRMGPLLADGGDAILATGPSATADMGDLVVGAHGPRSVHVLLVEGEP